MKKEKGSFEVIKEDLKYSFSRWWVLIFVFISIILNYSFEVVLHFLFMFAYYSFIVFCFIALKKAVKLAIRMLKT